MRYCVGILGNLGRTVMKLLTRYSLFSSLSKMLPIISSIIWKTFLAIAFFSPASYSRMDKT